VFVNGHTCQGFIGGLDRADRQGRKNKDISASYFSYLAIFVNQVFILVIVTIVSPGR
jgi:hypothetical protein